MSYELAKTHWKNMPEFVQNKQKPYKTLTIRFECKEDYDDFSKIIGQKLTDKTKSIWHPYKPHSSGEIKRWVTEISSIPTESDEELRQ
jgi:hypothetical protein